MPEPNKAVEKETSRIEAFSDGVFGVAITLLAVEIAVPKGTSESNGALTHNLLQLWPTYIAYFVTFVQVLLMWMAHHTIFAMLRKTNNWLMLGNGLLLLLVVLVPFPAKTLGEFITTGAKHTAIVFYSGYFVLIAVAFNLLLAVAVSGNGKLLLPDVSTAIIRQVKIRQVIGLLCNIFITIIAFFDVWVSLFLNVLMWGFWAFLSVEKKTKIK